ncbi:uncharacterized protein CMU_021740 [Cryptosporidium muris RN66]|uniref:Uncharacterized protein n=1 Tax=Cryptosporidium muris (strain RN66) TaxID=441375 RepID=B6AJL9_CRYMR|nr:uncharacterized protein CMU_021740 [Cryptosporidium muris RN66]EEA08410.1 hypothetical protein, conserved [Cryptosporidium muris RN66]|eukprot:XP_002142759.1 hypothetical protein [Cryptosporidium muris RN66]
MRLIIKRKDESQKKWLIVWILFLHIYIYKALCSVTLEESSRADDSSEEIEKVDRSGKFGEFSDRSNIGYSESELETEVSLSNLDNFIKEKKGSLLFKPSKDASISETSSKFEDVSESARNLSDLVQENSINTEGYIPLSREVLPEGASLMIGESSEISNDSSPTASDTDSIYVDTTYNKKSLGENKTSDINKSELIEFSGSLEDKYNSPIRMTSSVEKTNNLPLMVSKSLELNSKKRKDLVVDVNKSRLLSEEKNVGFKQIPQTTLFEMTGSSKEIDYLHSNNSEKPSNELKEQGNNSEKSLDERIFNEVEEVSLPELRTSTISLSELTPLTFSESEHSNLSNETLSTESSLVFTSPPSEVANQLENREELSNVYNKLPSNMKMSPESKTVFQSESTADITQFLSQYSNKSDEKYHSKISDSSTSMFAEVPSDIGSQKSVGNIEVSKFSEDTSQIDDYLTPELIENSTMETKPEINTETTYFEESMSIQPPSPPEEVIEPSEVKDNIVMNPYIKTAGAVGKVSPKLAPLIETLIRQMEKDGKSSINPKPLTGRASPPTIINEPCYFRDEKAFPNKEEEAAFYEELENQKAQNPFLYRSKLEEMKSIMGISGKSLLEEFLEKKRGEYRSNLSRQFATGNKWKRSTVEIQEPKKALIEEMKSTKFMENLFHSSHKDKPQEQGQIFQESTQKTDKSQSLVSDGNIFGVKYEQTKASEISNSDILNKKDISSTFLSENFPRESPVLHIAASPVSSEESLNQETSEFSSTPKPQKIYSYTSQYSVESPRVSYKPIPDPTRSKSENVSPWVSQYTKSPKSSDEPISETNSLIRSVETSSSDSAPKRKSTILPFIQKQSYQNGLDIATLTDPIPSPTPSPSPLAPIEIFPSSSKVLENSESVESILNPTYQKFVRKPENKLSSSGSEVEQTKFSPLILLPTDSPPNEKTSPVSIKLSDYNEQAIFTTAKMHTEKKDVLNNDLEECLNKAKNITINNLGILISDLPEGPTVKFIQMELKNEKAKMKDLMQFGQDALTKVEKYVKKKSWRSKKKRFKDDILRMTKDYYYNVKSVRSLLYHLIFFSQDEVMRNLNNILNNNEDNLPFKIVQCEILKQIFNSHENSVRGKLLKKIGQKNFINLFRAQLEKLLKNKLTPLVKGIESSKSLKSKFIKSLHFIKNILQNKFYTNSSEEYPNLTVEKHKRSGITNFLLKLFKRKKKDKTKKSSNIS